MRATELQERSKRWFNQYGFGPWCPPHNVPDEDLLEAAKVVRRSILRGTSPRYCCFLISVSLEAYLASVIGIRVHLTNGIVWGTRHCWLTLPDDRILDSTASQFPTLDNGRMPAVYLGQKPTWYCQGKAPEQKA